MIALLFTFQLTLATAQFEAELVDGNTVSGTIAQWADGVVTMKTENGVESISVDELARLVRENGEQPRAPTIQVGLDDGTSLLTDSLNVSDGIATLDWLGNPTIQISTRKIQFVRLRVTTIALRQQWQEMLDTQHNGDVLVIRRNASSLDYLEGLIRGITDVHVIFEFDDQQIEVDRTKLEGFIFFRRPDAMTARSPPMTVHFGSQQVVHARDATLLDGKLMITTENATTLSSDPGQVTRIDFMSGRITYLSDMVPITRDVTPALGTRLNSDAVTALLYNPRKDKDFRNQPLRLKFPSEDREESFEKGLALHSRTQLTYRLSREYRHLRGIVGLDPQSPRGGRVLFEIAVDGKVQHSQIITPSSDPVPIDVDVAGANRLSILVDYGDDGDFGDRVHLCNLRALK